MNKIDSSRINHHNGVYSDEEIILKSFKRYDSIIPDGLYRLQFAYTSQMERMNNYKNGAVVVGYMSLENGLIDSFKIVKSIFPTFDSFAIECVKFMAETIIYSVNDKPVKVYHERPILFMDDLQKFRFPNEFKKIKPVIEEKRYGEAIKLILPLISEYPFNIDLIVTLAMCYYKNGDKIRSYKYYRIAYDLGSVYGFTKLNTKSIISHILDNEFKSE